MAPPAPAALLRRDRRPRRGADRVPHLRPPVGLPARRLARPVAPVDPPRPGPHPARLRSQPRQRLPGLRRRLPRSRRPRLFASPAWRTLAAGGPARQQQFLAEIGQRLGRPGYQPAGTSDPIAHWMTYDSWHPPSRPHTTFPQTRRYGSGPDRPATTNGQSLQRHERSTLWFRLYRRGGRVILHHGRIREPGPRLVTQDGRHRRHHLGQPDHAASRA
jgi:hypothetical protein